MEQLSAGLLVGGFSIDKRRLPDKQDYTLNRIEHLEKYNEKLLEKIKQAEERHEKLLEKILELNRKIDSLLE